MQHEDEIAPNVAPVARAPWRTPVLRVLAASGAELHVGGAIPDAEGTS